MKKNALKAELTKVLMLLVAAFVSFTSLYVFVIPSNFSPSGIDGISTILYEITGINIGWFKIAFNIPLLILAWIYLKKRYVVYVVLFTMLDSFGVIVLEQINFFTFIPAGLSDVDAVGYRLIAAIFAGVALGIATAIMLKLDCSTGGVDIVSCLVNLKKPNFHVERVTSIICYCVIACSYFVYWDLTSILLSVIQIFVYECTVPVATTLYLPILTDAETYTVNGVEKKFADGKICPCGKALVVELDAGSYTFVQK